MAFTTGASTCGELLPHAANTNKTPTPTPTRESICSPDLCLPTDSEGRETILEFVADRPPTRALARRRPLEAVIGQDSAARPARLAWLYERLHGLSFGPPDADLGQARIATRADGALVGIRRPLAAHEQ